MCYLYLYFVGECVVGDVCVCIDYVVGEVVVGCWYVGVVDCE